MKKYKWNENGVCLNPESPINTINGRRGFSIEVAQAPDGTYRAGHHIVFPAGMAIHGTNIKGDVYRSDKEAIRSELKKVIARCDCPKEVVKAARGFLMEYIFEQQKLF